MARLTPVEIPAGVDVSINDQLISVKGSKGTLEHNIHTAVEVTKEGNVISFASREGVSGGPAQSGTARAVIGNMLKGVSQGFEMHGVAAQWKPPAMHGRSPDCRRTHLLAEQAAAITAKERF